MWQWNINRKTYAQKQMMPTHKRITLRVWLDGGREEIESREEVAGNSKERRARGRIQIFKLVVNSHVL